MPEFAAVEWLAKAEDVRVRVMTLAPGEGTPWHRHTAVTDYVFGLDDGLEIGLREPDGRVALRPGARQDIPPGRVHRVVNPTARPLRYLLVQATGAYDFVEVT
jgi:quercetin dioxygenase-like cupin family protein